MSKYSKKQTMLALTAMSVSLMLSGCDWGIIGSSPEPVVIRPPVLNPTGQPTLVTEEVKGPPTAKALASRPGYVFNPYTGNIVDVQGLSSGLLVRDPEDSDKTHTFYVP